MSHIDDFLNVVRQMLTILFFQEKKTILRFRQNVYCTNDYIRQFSLRLCNLGVKLYTSVIYPYMSFVQNFKNLISVEFYFILNSSLEMNMI